ncbi:MAG: universal stress protein [Anaerolineales bacterium]
MGLILCATRGGEASYHTQQAAIALAKENGDEIVFLYIIDLHFLDKTAAPIVVNIENELDQMGQFFLLMAKERATEQGVEVRTITRKGNVREEIINAVLDEGATRVVLGRPVGKQSAFQESSLQSFTDEIERVTEAIPVLV